MFSYNNMLIAVMADILAFDRYGRSAKLRAGELINAGCAMINGTVCRNPFKVLAADDIVTVR